MYLPDDFAIVPTIDDAPFWAACKQKRLVFQRCAACGAFRHPPLPCCARCGSAKCEWVEAPGQSELFSWTVCAGRPGTNQPERYVVGLVIFRACGNVRLVTNIVSPAPERLVLGMPVELAWESYGDGFVPRFRGCEREDIT